jgi:hypothetical protein
LGGRNGIAGRGEKGKPIRDFLIHSLQMTLAFLAIEAALQMLESSSVYFSIQRSA